MSVLGRLRGVLTRGERGSVAPAIPIIAFTLLLLGGLVIDASRQLNERGLAVAYAEEAARAGAQAVDLTRDDLTLLPRNDPEGPAERVAKYCRAVLQLRSVSRCEFAGIESSAGANPRPIVVRARVEMELPATLLGMVGVRTLGASGEGRARPFQGTDADNAG